MSQVGGMILVVHNSKELDVQRKLFLESMSLSVSIVKPRTSSHQAISEALDELQVCFFVVCCRTLLQPIRDIRMVSTLMLTLVWYL